MKKRQLKKEQKKLTLLAAQEVLNACLEADDPLAALHKIRTQGEQYFQQLELDVPPTVFNELMIQLEPIVKELGSHQ